jgi:hypothetical protein
LLAVHTSYLLFTVVEDFIRTGAGNSAIIAQNDLPDLRRSPPPFNMGSLTPSPSEGFYIRRFSGGFPAAMTPQCLLPSARMSAGSPLTLPKSIRRIVR